MALGDKKIDTDVGTGGAAPPAPSFAQKAGALAGAVVDAEASRGRRNLDFAQDMGRAAIDYARRGAGAVAGAARDFTAGFTGRPAGAAPPPRAAPIAPVRSASAAVAPATTAATLSRPARPALSESPSEIGPASTLASIPRPMPGDRNTFTGSNGQTRQVLGDGTITGQGSSGAGTLNIVPAAAFARPARPAPSSAMSQYAADVASAQARNAATQARIARPKPFAENAGDFRPGASTGLTTAERRSLPGRMAAAEQANAARGAVLQADTQTGIAQQENATRLAAAQLGERGADRRLGAELQARATESAAERLARPRQPITLADGTLATLGSDGSLSPVSAPDGKPARVAQPRQPGAVTPALQYQALGDELATLQANAMADPGPDAREDIRAQFDKQQAAITQVRSRMESLAGGATQPVEGGVYTDAQGNQARFVNGQYVLL
jgi:hypothetical protein